LDAATSRPLTDRQRRVLEYIRASYRQNGFPPTFRMIADEHGFASLNAIYCHVNPLVRKGALRRVEVGRAVRYIPVVPDGCCPCCGRAP
jgi:repressor LexA